MTIIADRIRKFNLRRQYRDDLISKVSAMRDSNESISSIAKKLELSESTVRQIIKYIL